MKNKYEISDIGELTALYGNVSARALTKELDYISAEYKQLIEASPFMAIATIGDGGLDCSPRGEKNSVVEVVGDKTLRFADRPGNNRLDSLSNIVEDGRVALLFLIPGVTETMRVNGRAKVTNNPMLLKHFEVNEKLPVVVVEVSVESVYFQCSKAIYRAELWETELADRKSLPSSGEIFKTIEETSFDHESYDKESETRLRKSLY